MSYRVAEVISAAELSVEDFPKIALRLVTIYDRKNRVMSEPTLRFKDFLFINNENSKESFAKLLGQMEANPPTSELFAQIDENSVSIWCNDFNKKMWFSRLPPPDPNQLDIT